MTRLTLLSFLLIGLMAAYSIQQQNDRWLLPVLSHYYVPRTFAQPAAEEDWRIHPDAAADDVQEDLTTYVQPRRASKPGQNGLNHRVFFGGLANPFLSAASNPYLFQYSRLYSSTVFTTSTVTSTILTATVTTCIPSAQFVPASLAAGINSCQRRRRMAVDISPSTVYALVPSKVSATLEDRTLQTDNKPIIVSSKDEDPVSYKSARAFGFNNNNNNNNVITLVTTLTSYIFNSTVIKKTITPAVEAGKLGCLPPGMVLC